MSVKRNSTVIPKRMKDFPYSISSSRACAPNQNVKNGSRSCKYTSRCAAGIPGIPEIPRPASPASAAESPQGPRSTRGYKGEAGPLAAHGPVGPKGP